MEFFLTIKNKIKNNYSVLRAILWSCVLWFLLWAGYDTDPNFNSINLNKVFGPNGHYTVLNLIHAVRGFLPLVAMVLAIIFLLKKRQLPKHFFSTPLGLLLLYTIVGAIASIFSANPLMSLYSAALYGSIIIVLMAILSGPEPQKTLSLIMNINWVIAAAIAIGLIIFFLIQPGVIPSLTPNLLICGNRPYEGLAGVSFEVNTLGVAGTRPTGLGRYAGVAAVVCLFIYCFKKKKSKYIWMVWFLLFLAILIFARGRTEILGFLVAAPVVLLLGRKYKYFLMFLMGLLIFSVGFNLSYKSICPPPPPKEPLIAMQQATPVPTQTPKPVAIDETNPTFNQEAQPVIQTKPKPVVTPAAPKANPIAFFTKSTNPLTLSGRTTGVWPEAWQLFLGSPLLGYGFLADRIFLQWQHAHNSLLQVLIQSGILGTIPFVLAFVITFIYLLQAVRATDITEKERYWLMGMLGVFVFFAVRSLTESTGTFYSSDWLFLAPIVAYVTARYQKNDLKNTQSMKVGENKVDIISITETISLMGEWLQNKTGKAKWIVVTGMHGIVESYKNSGFKDMLNSADLFVPDGISLVWLAKMKGFDIKDRVSGADLMDTFFMEAEKKGWSSYFYGDTDETLKELKIQLLKKFPNLKIVGMYSPPFRKITEDEDNQIINMINDAKPDVLWVGLGLPKQETWIFNHKDRLNIPIVVGVGAAFKFLSGKVKRAPAIVGKLGFEWLWRLIFETKTTWKRVFYGGPIFLWIVIKDFFRIEIKQRMIELITPLARETLLFIEKNILFPIGIFLGPKLLKQLTPYDVKGFEEKTRLGNLSDGGYVVPSKVLPLIGVAYSYGIGGDVSFEEDLERQTGVNIRMYDHTVNGLPKENKNFFFKKQGIAKRKHGSFDTFKHHLEENGDIGKKMMLKLDIEGDEWKILDDIINELSKNIVVIVLEIHKLYRYEKILKYINVLKKVNSKFTLVHLHGNNNGKLFAFGNKEISSTMELTLINNNLISEKSVMVRSLPSEKDYPNIKVKEDVILDFWKNS